MGGPHPAVAAVRSAVRRVLPASPARVLVACSGGADSLALAAAVAHEARGRAGLVTVDHGLHAGSAAQAARVVEIGTALGLAPARCVAVEVRATGGGLEDAARRVRLAALSDAAAADGAVAVLLGHTRDDQAEQVLLGLARGSGARSLAGIPSARGVFLRPLLELPRAVTVAACAALGLQPWSDPANADPSSTRVRARTRVLPLLEAELGPGVAAALARTAVLLRADADALDELAAAAYARCCAPGDAADQVALEVTALAALPAALRGRVLRLASAHVGAGSLSAAQTDALDALVTRWRGQGPVALPGGGHGRRTGGWVVLAPTTMIQGSSQSDVAVNCPGS